MGIYEDLGLRPVINGYATVTRLGGSLMPPPVVEAMIEASCQFVDLGRPASRRGPAHCGADPQRGGVCLQRRRRRPDAGNGRLRRRHRPGHDCRPATPAESARRTLRGHLPAVSAQRLRLCRAPGRRGHDRDWPGAVLASGLRRGAPRAGAGAVGAHGGGAVLRARRGPPRRAAGGGGGRGGRTRGACRSSWTPRRNCRRWRTCGGSRKKAPTS